MTARPLIMRVAALASAFGIAWASGSVVRAESASAAASERGRVLIVAVPRVTWADIANGAMPALRSWINDAAVASLSPRTIGPRTSLAEGYLTIGAGNRAAAPVNAAVVLGPDEAYGGHRASDEFAVRVGSDPAGAAAFAINAPDITRYNNSLSYGAKPGALGSALRGASRRAGVVANNDVFDADGLRIRQREAALAVIDFDGAIDDGVVGADLTDIDPMGAFGIVDDPEHKIAVATEVWARAQLLVYELSDLDRVDGLRESMAARAATLAWTEALRAADREIARVLALADTERDTVMVLSPAAPRAGERLMVFAARGPDSRPGRVRSATTRRSGYVTLPDVAPTILRALDIDIPDSMTGTPIVAVGGGAIGRGQLWGLADAAARTHFRDRIAGPFEIVLSVTNIILFALVVLALHVPRLRPARRTLMFCCLAVPACIPATYLLGLGNPQGLGSGGFGAVVAASGLALGALASVFAIRAPWRGPTFVALMILTLLVVDVLFGGRMQIDTVLGYSPVVAGRFSGFGNVAYSLVTSTAILGGVGLFALLTNPRGLGRVARRELRWWVAAAVMAGAVIVDGFPSWGSDAGGVVANVPAVAVVLILLGGARLRARTFATIALITGGIVGLVTVIDLLRPADSRTHLGRLASRIGSDLPDLVARKFNANLSTLTGNIGSLLTPIGLAAVWFIWNRSRQWPLAVARTPALRVGAIGVLAAATLGYAVNDSGIAVTSTMLTMLIPFIGYLVLAEGAPATPDRAD